MEGKEKEKATNTTFNVTVTKPVVAEEKRVRVFLF